MSTKSILFGDGIVDHANGALTQDCCLAGLMCDEGKSLLHWTEGVTIRGFVGIEADKEISPLVAVKVLDGTLLDLLSSLLPCLYQRTDNGSRKRMINVASEQLRAAKVAKVRATTQEAAHLRYVSFCVAISLRMFPPG